ncbi:hypothetical protein vBKpnAMK6_00470 [Klebsiella phage vB_Kpn_AM_K6]
MIKYAAVLGLVLAFSVNAENSMSDSLRIAKTFCNTNGGY